mmetsp:Transcript_18512/g.27167  ORF Transcript_18512/g.27167 Transcript_18512/m.27167 type:complete len:141 (-) Transcript_18512:350-772(-)
MNTRIRLIHSVPPSKTEMDFQQEKAAEIRRLPRVSAIPRQILGRVQMHLAGIRMNRAAILIMRTHQILGEEATVKQAQTMDFSTTKRMMFSTLLLPRFQLVANETNARRCQVKCFKKASEKSKIQKDLHSCEVCILEDVF